MSKLDTPTKPTTAKFVPLVAAEAINSIREGNNTVTVTSSASGKSLCYNLPVSILCFINFFRFNMMGERS